jgi:hypothetical protein
MRTTVAGSPCGVSLKPRRSSQPMISSSTLAMKGMRQPQVATFSAPSSSVTSHAQAEPRMNPSVTPDAAELLTRPRRAGGASSVVYTIEPVNSPPSEKPWINLSSASAMGAATPIAW